MKVKMILLFLLISCSLTSFAQDVWQPKFGYSRVKSGNGDIYGHLLQAGVQKQFTKRSGLEVLASGTYIEQYRHWGQWHTIFFKSNGMALEGNYNFFLNLGPFQVYPAVGPVVRYASESYIRSLAVSSDSQGNITEFNYEIDYLNKVRAGYSMVLNMDFKTNQRFALGLRAAIQSFPRGNHLTSLGVTVKI